MIRHLRRKFLFVLALLASAAPSRADELPPAPKEVFAELRYPFWNSGLYPFSAHYGQIGWMDDDTLIFEATEHQWPVVFRGVDPSDFVRYRWKLGGRPERAGDGPELAKAGFCPPVSRPVPPGTPRGVPDGVPMSTFFGIPQTGCELYADPAMARRPYVTDPDRNYYLEFAPIQYGKFKLEESGLVHLLARDGSNRVALPIWSGNARPSCTRFDRAALQFFVWNCFQSGPSLDRGSTLAEWKLTGCRKVWRVSAKDATTEEICIPYGDWAGDAEIVPTRAGLLVTSSRGPTKAYPNDPGAAGLYSFEGRKVRRIFGGLLYNPSVSPNGCRVAFHLLPSMNVRLITPYPATTMVIDVCSAS